MVGTEGGPKLFETAEKGGVMKNGPFKRGRVMQICVRDHVEVHPQKKKEVLYFVGLLMLSSKMYVYGITKNRLEIYFELS